MGKLHDPRNNFYADSRNVLMTSWRHYMNGVGIGRPILPHESRDISERKIHGRDA